MNFDFIKNLDGLNKAFNSCEDAEQYAKSKPYISLFSSRKSAEAIAKFVYLVAHSEKAEELSFADVLSDYTVKDYLRKKSVLDAFHFIRKKGNLAVHMQEQGSPEMAIAVLEKLHFAVGEVAKRMGLIKNYPQFNPDIIDNSTAVPESMDTADELAMEMHEDYVLTKHKVKKLKAEFLDAVSEWHVLPGKVELNEYIEFNSKPLEDGTVRKIQEHFGNIGMQAFKYLNGEIEPDHDITYQAELTIKGQDSYTTTNLGSVLYGIFYDLPDADSFSITSYYKGPSVVACPLSDQENFTYKAFEFLFNHGSGWCRKYENGHWLGYYHNDWVDLFEKDSIITEMISYNTDILDKNYGMKWWCWNLDLYVDFDFNKHPHILSALQDAVRRHIPKDQLEYCEGTWEDGEYQILVHSIGWEPLKLRVVQDFLDEINAIIEPIKNECSCDCEGDWYITRLPFAVATWVWTDDGFKVIGVEY